MVSIVSKLASFGSKSSHDSNGSGKKKSIKNSKEIRESRDFRDLKEEKENENISKRESRRIEKQVTTEQQRKKGQKTFRKPQDLEKISILGKGSYGEVHLVRNKETGMLHALKIMKLDNDSSVTQIMEEIDILHGSSSKYIVRYDGYYLEKNCLSILMEYCSGGSLYEILTVLQRPLTEVEVSCCIYGLLKALDSLHKNKKIHRDIKAGNILMSDEGRVKLADFGVSRSLNNSSSLARTVIGTPLWMAPEILQELKYSYSADIWSVGITAIELAEGKPPLYHIRPTEALFYIIQSPPPTLSNPDQFSEEMNDFISQCLQKSPNDRATAYALLRHSFIKNHYKKSKKILCSIIEEINQKYQEAGGKEAYFQKLKEKGKGDPVNISTDQSTDDDSDDDSSADDSDTANYSTVLMGMSTMSGPKTIDLGIDSNDTSDDDTDSTHSSNSSSSSTKKSNKNKESVVNNITKEEIEVEYLKIKDLSKEDLNLALSEIKKSMKNEIFQLEKVIEMKRKKALQVRYTLEGNDSRIPPTLPSRSSKPDLKRLLDEADFKLPPE